MATFTSRTDNKLMELLKINELRHIIAHTSHGDLTLQLRKGETKYQLVLDAVPVDKEIHDEVLELIYPTKIVVPQVQKTDLDKIVDNSTTVAYINENVKKVTYPALKKPAKAKK